MTGYDPIAAWRDNPFFILEVATDASRADVERAGQKLLALLALGSASAGRYDTPLGPAIRDADGVRQALAALRDPVERVVHELWAGLAPSAGGPRTAAVADAWTGAGGALGWTGKCPA
jgi:hypothetical protein